MAIDPRGFSALVRLENLNAHRHTGTINHRQDKWSNRPDGRNTTVAVILNFFFHHTTTRDFENNKNFSNRQLRSTGLPTYLPTYQSRICRSSPITSPVQPGKAATNQQTSSNPVYRTYIPLEDCYAVFFSRSIIFKFVVQILKF